MKKLAIPLISFISAMMITSCNSQDFGAEYPTVTDKATTVTDTYIITKTVENTSLPSTVTTTVLSTPYLEETEEYSDEEIDMISTFMDSLHTPESWTLMDKTVKSDRGVVAYFVMDKEIGANTHDDIDVFLAEIFNMDKDAMKQSLSRQDSVMEGGGVVSTGTLSLSENGDFPKLNIEYYIENNGTGRFSEAGGYADFTIQIDKEK